MPKEGGPPACPWVFPPAGCGRTGGTRETTVRGCGKGRWRREQEAGAHEEDEDFDGGEAEATEEHGNE